ncbi:MAG TPA: hypothetical protein VKY85_23550 [Candidatus Angelobacter sp.]|nr:hypothetical protein [Candidatus Angelobacter sp.]
MGRFILYLAWAWEILIGVILITPIGPFCIACTNAVQPPDFIGRTAVVSIGVISIVLGVLGFINGARAQARTSAASAG